MKCTTDLANIYLFKANNRNIRTRRETIRSIVVPLFFFIVKVSMIYAKNLIEKLIH